MNIPDISGIISVYDPKKFVKIVREEIKVKKRILSFVTALVLLIGLVPGSAFAVEADYSGSCGESLYWSFNPDTGALSITGTGEMTDYDSRRDDEKAPWTAAIGASRITSLHIADGITHIGDYAFADLINITSVVIPGTVISIGKYSFENTGLLEIKLPDSVKKIDSMAFRDCGNLKSVSLPQSLEIIENGAFRNCTSLEVVQIPATASEIHYTTFSDCTNLAQINVDEDNPYYSSRDGVLYNKEQTLLIKCPGGYRGGELVIPNSVKEIQQLAFTACQNLSSVVIPDGVTKIPSETFSECPNLTTIEIPISVTSIPGNFYNTPITDVYYGGGQEDWEKISGLDDIHNEALRNATIHYNSTGGGQTEYCVTYNFNDEGTAPIVQSYLVGETVEILNQIPARDGYIFMGWSDGTTTYQPGNTFTMPESNVTLTAIWELISQGSQEINQDEVFIKQSVTGHGGGTCTLASATMMLRRQAILMGRSDWDFITESAVRKVAWAPGLRLKFSFQGMNVSAYPGVNVNEMTLAEKKSYFVSILKEHPEGIVIYRTDSSQWHAVLLTDYDETTDTFYCADPAPGALNGRIPLSESTIYSGGTQDQKIASIDQIWYIASATTQKALSHSLISAHCPVDMILTINGQILDSRTTDGTVSNDYATMTVTGSKADKEITVQINGPYVLNYDVDIELIGTGAGYMTFRVEHTFTDSTIETHTFENILLSDTITGNASGLYPQSTILLFINNSEYERSEVWATDPNEVTFVPADDNEFDQLPTEDITPDPAPSDDDEDHGDQSSGDYLITVDRVSGGRVTVQPGRADRGDTVTITVYPNDGYELDELVVTDSRGNEIDLDARSATRFTFTMPGGKVTVEASFVREGGQPQVPQTTFADVPASAWYYNAVEYVYENGLMSGVSGGRFAPDDTLTRAMLVQTLYAMEGRPAAASAGFADVASGDWYASAVNWAAANGVVSGVSETGFGPNNALTREQLALILYRFAQYKGYDVTGTSDLAAYADGSSVSGWAAEAMGWAVDAGLISGVGGNQIAPTGTATRAQVAQILMNFCENVAH